MNAAFDTFSEHPLAATAIGFFFLLQVGAFSILLDGLARCRREIAATRAVPFDAAVKNLHGKKSAWVDSCLSSYDATEERSFSERLDDFLFRFDQWLATRGSYLFLQRVSVMAPLLGVIITAAGFLSLRRSLGTDVESLLAALIPLIVGVGGGAMLAFVNQILLQIVDRNLDLLRLRAREWFVAMRALGDTAGELIDSRQESQRITIELMSAIGQQNRQIVGLLEEVTGNNNEATHAFRDTLERWQQVSKQAPHEFGKISDTMAETSRTVGAITPLLANMTKSFDSTVQIFKDSVAYGLQPVLAQQAQSSVQLSEIARTCLESLQRFDRASLALEEIVLRQKSVADRYHDVVENQLVPQQINLASSANRIEEATAAMAVPVEQFLTTMKDFVDGFSEGMEGFKSIRAAADAFSQGIHQEFLPAAAHHKQVLSSMHATAQQTADTSASLKDSVDRFGQSAEASRLVLAKFQDSVETAAVPAHSLLIKSVQNLEGATESLTEHADRFRAALQAHSNGVTGLEQKVSQTIDGISRTAEQLETAADTTLTKSFAATNSLVEQVASLVGHLEKSASQLQSWSRASESAAKSQSAATEKLEQILASVEQSVGRFGQLVKDTQNLLTNQLVPTQQGVLQAVQKLDGASGELIRFFENGIVPLTMRIQDLEKSFGQLNLAMQNIGSLASASRDATRFIEALDGASELAKTLERFPPQFMQELKRSLAENHSEQMTTSARRGFFRWPWSRAT